MCEMHLQGPFRDSLLHLIHAKKGNCYNGYIKKKIEFINFRLSALNRIYTYLHIAAIKVHTDLLFMIGIPHRPESETENLCNFRYLLLFCI